MAARLTVRAVAALVLMGGLASCSREASSEVSRDAGYRYGYGSSQMDRGLCEDIWEHVRENPIVDSQPRYAREAFVDGCVDAAETFAEDLENGTVTKPPQPTPLDLLPPDDDGYEREWGK